MASVDWLPAAMRARTAVRVLKAGETLFRQGDKAHAVFEVEQGQMRLVRQTIDAHPVVLHTARRGEFFAEAALFSGTYHCDALASTDARLRVYPKRELLAAFRGDPALGERFMAALARQVMALRSRLEQRNIRSARNRILHHLVLAAGADGRTVALEGTLMDLAAELGLTHEALYRALAALENEGAIERTKSRIVLRRASSV